MERADGAMPIDLARSAERVAVSETADAYVVRSANSVRFRAAFGSTARQLSQAKRAFSALADTNAHNRTCEGMRFRAPAPGLGAGAELYARRGPRRSARWPRLEG